MDSSISHSERRAPAFALKLLATAVVSWAICAGYMLFVNPEMVYLKRVWVGRQGWSQSLDQKYDHKFVFYGGSSCMFSIDGERMLQRHGLPAVNMGGLAGMNAKVLTECAIERLRPGDTLVLAVEPGLLVNEIEPTASAIQISYAMGAPRWIHGRLQPQWPADAGSLLALRPGAYHLFTFLGKLVRRRPLYRYTDATVHPSGFVETSARPDLLSPIPPPPRLAPDAQVLLRSLLSWASTNSIQVCYSLPWGCVSRNQLQDFRRRNAEFVLTISQFMPVLKDPALGAQEDRALFSDTEWHLGPEGSAQKSDLISRAILNKDFWTQEELRALASPKL